MGDLVGDEDAGEAAVRALTEGDVGAQHGAAALAQLMRRVVVPLFGTGVVFPANSAGEAYRELLLSEGVRLSSGGAAAQASMRGGYRRLLEGAQGAALSVSAEPDGSASIAASFSLRSGAYATSLLRELLCNHDFM